MLVGSAHIQASLLCAYSIMTSSSRADIRREMEAHMGGPPDDPNRCITDCKVWPKGEEPLDCYCQMRCVANISCEHETFGRRYWCCKNIKEVTNPVASAHVRSNLCFVTYNSLSFDHLTTIVMFSIFHDSLDLMQS